MKAMKKLLTAIVILITISTNAQITITVGSALLQEPGTDVHIPVSVKGLNAANGGIPVTGIELHVNYNNGILLYDTTLNFNSLVPASQWFYGVTTTDYSANWIEPALQKLSIPDNTVLFDIVFHYSGSPTELIIDTTRTILLDSAFEIIPGVHYVNGIVTPSQGSGDSRWNGTGPWNTAASWSNGIPGDSTVAIIESGEVTLQSNGGCKNLTINPGTTVVIAPNFSLTVHHGFNNNGSFHLMSDQTGTGSLIVSGQAAGTGQNTLERYLDFTGGISHLVSTPVTGAKASVFGAAVSEKYLEPSAGWQALSGNDDLMLGIGYKVAGTSSAAIGFTGSILTGDLTVQGLSYTSQGAASARGLNLAGNPYTSAIQWEKGNWGRTDLDYAAYVWAGYKFVTWNGVTGALKDGIIPAMQGFFVKSSANGASLTIPAGARLHHTQPYYKEAAATENLLDIKLESTAGNGFFDETFIHILPGSTAGFDGMYDAWKLFGADSYPQIYTTAGDQSILSINSTPDLNPIPVECKVGETGSYKITFSGFESFNPSQPLFFEDKQTSNVINIRNVNEYVFAANATTEPGRFLLHFAEVGLKDLAHGGIHAWYSNQHIHIASTEGWQEITEVVLFNSLGQTILSGGAQTTPVSLLTGSDLHGLYILKVKTREGTYIRKMIIPQGR